MPFWGGIECSLEALSHNVDTATWKPIKINDDEWHDLCWNTDSGLSEIATWKIQKFEIQTGDIYTPPPQQGFSLGSVSHLSEQNDVLYSLADYKDIYSLYSDKQCFCF